MYWYVGCLGPGWWWWWWWGIVATTCFWPTIPFIRLVCLLYVSLLLVVVIIRALFLLVYILGCRAHIFPLMALKGRRGEGFSQSRITKSSMCEHQLFYISRYKATQVSFHSCGAFSLIWFLNKVPPFHCSQNQSWQNPPLTLSHNPSMNDWAHPKGSLLPVKWMIWNGVSCAFLAHPQTHQNPISNAQLWFQQALGGTSQHSGLNRT